MLNEMVEPPIPEVTDPSVEEEAAQARADHSGAVYLGDFLSADNLCTEVTEKIDEAGGYTLDKDWRLAQYFQVICYVGCRDTHDNLN